MAEDIHFQHIEQVSLRVIHGDILSKDVLYTYLDMCDALIKFYQTRSTHDKAARLVIRSRIKAIEAHKKIFREYLGI